MNLSAIPRDLLLVSALLILVPLIVPDWVLFIMTKSLFMFICVSGVAFMLRGGLLTFGHALFYATGAYTVGFMVKYFGVQEL